MKESDHFMSHARFLTVSKTFQEMLKSPKTDCMIMTRETFESLEKYIERTSGASFGLRGITVYFHKWLGDLIVYGNSQNRVIKRIIESCDDRRGRKIKEVVQ